MDAHILCRLGALRMFGLVYGILILSLSLYLSPLWSTLESQAFSFRIVYTILLCSSSPNLQMATVLLRSRRRPEWIYIGSRQQQQLLYRES